MEIAMVLPIYTRSPIPEAEDDTHDRRMHHEIKSAASTLPSSAIAKPHYPHLTAQPDARSFLIR
jgi:hypothetical protein